jgi:hypothetical protein
MEAYQVEAEYGRTIEAYRGVLQMNGQNRTERNDRTGRTVEMLRIGRLALLYLSLDGKEAGQWNRTTKEWEVLPNTYRRSIARGLQIAKKQAAPQLITIPIPVPQKIDPAAKHVQFGQQAESDTRPAQERHNEGGHPSKSEVQP